MKKIILVLSLCLGLALMLVGCSGGGSSSGGSSSSIVLSQPTLSFDSIGEAQTITATTTPAGQEVQWLTSNASVATVSGGAVVATGNGTATITARLAQNTSIFTTCVVSVNSSILINKTGVTLYDSTDPTNSTTTLSVTTIPAGQDVTWTSGDTTKVTVQKTGVDTATITCINATPFGAVPITATITGTQQKAVCTVSPLTPQVYILMPHFFKINMCVSGASVFQGSSRVIAEPNNDLHYSITPSNVASINATTGEITALSSGTATMTVSRTDANSSASVEVLVANALTSTGFPSSLSVPIGDMVDIPQMTITPFMPSNTEVQYVTDNDNIAMIINLQGAWKVVHAGLGTTNIYGEVINTQTQQVVYKSAPCQITD